MGVYCLVINFQDFIVLKKLDTLLKMLQMLCLRIAKSHIEECIVFTSI